MTVRELRDLLNEKIEEGYADALIKHELTSYPCLWVFGDGEAITIKTPLTFTAEDLKLYTEQYYMAGHSPYQFDEDWAEHLYLSGFPQELVTEALGERWGYLYSKVVMSRCIDTAEKRRSE